MIEQALADNTAALRELSALLTWLKKETQSQTPTTEAKEKQAPKKAQAAVADNTASNTPETDPPAEVAAACTPAPDAPSQAANPDAGGVTDDTPPTYEETAVVVTALAKTKGRDAAVAVLRKFGAGKLPDVKPEDFAKLIAACHEAGA